MAPNHPSPALSSVDDLLERSHRLEVEALAQVHDLFYPEVYRYVRFRLDDDRLVEAVASDVFLVFLDAMTRRRGPERNLRGWLLETAACLVSDSLRKKRSLKTISRQAKPAISQNEHLDNEQASSQVDAKRELERAIRQAMAKMPADQQHFLAMRFAAGRSLEDAAQATTTDIETVKLLQFRALEMLRSRLAEA
jgi:RNA polymerase sigma-70 factor, ECF subfamily